MRCLNSSFSYFFLIVVVFCGGCCRSVESLVLLTPPGSHYGYYDASRNDLFDFYADFYHATALVGEPVVFVVTKAIRKGLDEGSYKELVKRLEDHHHSKNTDSLSSSSSSFKENVWLALMDDIWVRDFFPTQLNNQTVAKFKYSPAYLDVNTVFYINSATKRLLRSWEFPGLMDYNDLVMDGGGIVLDPDNSMAVLTERILRDNPFLAGRPLDETGLGPSSNCCLDDPYGLLLHNNTYNSSNNNVWFTDEEIAIGEATLASLLGYETVAIVPEEPSAPRLGHVDGLCNWLAPGVLALSNFSDPSHYQEYQELLQEKLGDTVTIVPFPYVITNDTFFDGFESAFGIYVNFLRTQQALYLPVFGGGNSSSSNPQQQERYGEFDELALEIARNYSDLPVLPVDASRVAIMGGSVRCLSQHLWGSTNADYLLQKVAAARAKDDDNQSASTSAAAAIVQLSPWQQLGSLVAMVGFLF